MKKALLTLIFAVALAAVATTARAEFFINGYGGLTFPDDADTEIQARQPVADKLVDAEIEMNMNFSGGLAGGYWFNDYGMPFFGVMLDHNASFPTFDRLNAMMLPSLPAYPDNYTLNGNPKIFQTTLNVLLRYPNKFMSPYIGAGAGLYTMDIIDTEILVPGGRIYLSDETAHTVGWNAFVGAEMPWPWSLLHKNLAGYMEYRYTTANFDFDPNVRETAGVGGPIGPFVNGSEVSLEMDHSASVLYGGFTWHFN